MTSATRRKKREFEQSRCFASRCWYTRFIRAFPIERRNLLHFSYAVSCKPNVSMSRTNNSASASTKPEEFEEKKIIQNSNLMKFAVSDFPMPWLDHRIGHVKILLFSAMLPILLQFVGSASLQACICSWESVNASKSRAYSAVFPIHPTCIYFL